MGIQTPVPAIGFEAALARAGLFDVPVFLLARFRRLMALEGWIVDLPRMCVDTLYAHERIAQAHNSAIERLRQVAFDLFAAFDRRLLEASLH
jgi:hypothetical protein